MPVWSRNLDKNALIMFQVSLLLMDKTALALALAIAVMLSMIVGVQLSPLIKANIMVGVSHPMIHMLSPINGTYNTNNLFLSVNFTAFTTGLYDGGPRYENTRMFTYTLDEKGSHNITIIRQYIGINPGANVFFECEESLNDLTEGLHNLTVRAFFFYSSFNPSKPLNITTESESIVFFRVGTVPQNITIIKPENITYPPSEVPLSYSIDEPASWIGYSLDGQENVTVTGNMTLPEVSLGQHNLTIFASGAFGNYASPKAISFNVVASFPTTLVVASVITITVIVSGLLVYFKKRKHKVEH